MATKENTTTPSERGTITDESPRADGSPSLRCRRLKVGYAYTDPERNLPHRPVPHLRLAGRWLKEAGFTIGQHVKIEVSEGRLTIEPVA
jgi:hypothetical protein